MGPRVEMEVGGLGAWVLHPSGIPMLTTTTSGGSGLGRLGSM